MALIDNIVGYWKFDENTGTTVGDSTASALTGTWTGTTGSQWIAGIVGSGGNFNGTDLYVTAGSKSLSLGTSITLSFWVYPTTLTAATYYCWFSFGGYIAGGFILQRAGDSGDKIRFAWAGTDTYDSVAFSTTGSWQHLVCVVSAGVPTTMYVNNVATSFVRQGGVGTFSATDPKALELGRRGDNTQYINGIMDEVGLWNRALPPGEVAELYNNKNGLPYPFTHKLGAHLYLKQGFQ
jgi:hypothetical protein